MDLFANLLEYSDIVQQVPNSQIMTEAPLRIVVFGARGLQGGSVVRALLASAQDVKVVAVTREPEKLKVSTSTLHLQYCLTKEGSRHVPMRT